MTAIQKSIGISALTSIVGIAALLAGMQVKLAIPTLALILAYITLYGFASLVVTSPAILYPTAVIPFAAALFFLPQNPWLYAGGILALIIGAFGLEQIRSEAATTLTVRSWRVLRAGIPTILTAISLVISLFYYVHAAVQETAVFIPRPVYDFAFPFLTRQDVWNALGIPTSSNLERIRADITIDQAIGILLENAIAKAEGNATTPSELISLQRKALAEQLGTQLKGDEKVGDVLYNLVNARANELAMPYTRYLPFAFSVGVFFAAKALSFPFHWLGAVLCSFIFFVARKTGFLRESESTITVVKYSL